MASAGFGRKEAARRIGHFVRGAHRLAITSASLAALLGLVEEECHAVLEAMAATGMLRKEARGLEPPLYCKD